MRLTDCLLTTESLVEQKMGLSLREPLAINTFELNIHTRSSRKSETSC